MVPVNDPNGQRTSQLITRYSVFLTAFPLFVSTLGLTSSMFAVEGTAANMYLLYLAKKFSDDRSEKNAKSVFFCSLWYLPVLLAAFVFHSRMWAEEKNENSELLISRVREGLRSVCAHEVIYGGVKMSNGDGQDIVASSGGDNEYGNLLCPKTLSKTVKHNIKQPELSGACLFSEKKDGSDAVA